MTDKPKWTPGPWRTNKYGGIGSGEYGIAPTIIDGNGWSHDWSKQESARRDADRHLIAAAPAMYEALEAWASGFDGFSPSELHKRYAPAEIARIEMTIVALRAARGEP